MHLFGSLMLRGFSNTLSPFGTCCVYSYPEYAPMQETAMPIETEKLKTNLGKMDAAAVRLLVRDIYDERKHNRKLEEPELKKLKELEKAAEKRLKELNVLNEKTEKDYKDWKKKMDKERRCY